MQTSFHETDFIQGDNWQPATELSVTNCSREGDRGPDARTKRWKNVERRETTRWQEFSSHVFDDVLFWYIHASKCIYIYLYLHILHTCLLCQLLVAKCCKYSLLFLGLWIMKNNDKWLSRLSRSPFHRQLKVTPSPTSCSSSSLPWELSPPDQADGQGYDIDLKSQPPFSLNTPHASWNTKEGESTLHHH